MESDFLIHNFEDVVVFDILWHGSFSFDYDLSREAGVVGVEEGDRGFLFVLDFGKSSSWGRCHDDHEGFFLSCGDCRGFLSFVDFSVVVVVLVLVVVVFWWGCFLFGGCWLIVVVARTDRVRTSSLSVSTSFLRFPTSECMA